jgi:hypothetical protein
MSRSLSAVDRDALKRAIEIAKAESPGRAAQITDKLKTESWRAVAEFAAYVAQHVSLKTRPWEFAPVDVDEDDPIPDGDDVHRRGRAIKLLRRLLKAGLSPYEPSPIEALARVEGKVLPPVA